MKAVLFDLDNTLYPAERDLFSLIDVRINNYMEDVVAIDPAAVDGLRRRYWKDYGATLQGLIRHHEIDPEDYLDYVHAVDVGSRLSCDNELQKTLNALRLPSYVFTNGSRCHVDRVHRNRRHVRFGTGLARRHAAHVWHTRDLNLIF